MRLPVASCFFLLVQTISTAVFAAEPAAPSAPPPQQPAAPVAPGATGAPPSEASPPAAAATAPVAAPVNSAPKSGVACVVGYHPPEFPDSARTATELVCEELRNRGVPVGTATYDAANAASAYVIHLDQLGSTFFLRIVHEEPVGTVRATRRVSMAELSEAEVAAPRLADAIVGKKTIKETEAYDNVVGSEARRYKKKKGEVVVGAGIAGLSMPGADAYMGPAFNGFLYYETTHLGLGLQVHVGDATTEDNEDADFVAWSVGGRYYFSDADITPFAGVGLSLASISMNQEDAYRYEGSGLTAFGEVGMEFFRLYSTHLIASLRVDVPFFSLQSDDDYYFDGVGTVSSSAPDESRYEVPLSLNVGIGF